MELREKTKGSPPYLWGACLIPLIKPLILPKSFVKRFTMRLVSRKLKVFKTIASLFWIAIFLLVTNYELLLLFGGEKVPPETISLKPSATDISSGRSSSFGTTKKKPFVGLGVVGKKT